MDIHIESVDRITFMIPQGRLDFGAAAGFQAQVIHVIDEPRVRGVVIDCTALDYVSSAGLRVFLIAARTAKRAAVAFAVCSLRPAVRDVFEVSGFGQLVAVYADRALTVEHIPS